MKRDNWWHPLHYLTAPRLRTTDLSPWNIDVLKTGKALFFSVWFKLFEQPLPKKTELLTLPITQLTIPRKSFPIFHENAKNVFVSQNLFIEQKAKYLNTLQ